MHERSCSTSALNHIISPHRHLPYQQRSWDYQKYHEFIFAVIIITIYIYHGQCMNAHVLLCSMVYQPHSFPPSISSFIIEIAFAIIWATGTRLAFAMFRSGTTSVRTSEIGKYPDGILPQHGLWTMDYGLSCCRHTYVLRPRLNCRHCADDIIKCITVNARCSIFLH